MAQKEIFEKKFNGGWKKVITKAPYKDGFRTDPYLYTPDGKKLRYAIVSRKKYNFFSKVLNLTIYFILIPGQIMNYIITSSIMKNIGRFLIP